MSVEQYNTLNRKFVPYLGSNLACYGFEQVGNSTEAFKNAADQFQNDSADFVFFRCPKTEPLTSRLGGVFGSLPNDTDSIFLMNIGGEEKFLYEGDVTDVAAIIIWLNKFVAGDLKPYVNSQSRPENDRDPEHPTLTKLTANSFHELVVDDTSTEYLVDIWAPWCGPCVALAPAYLDVSKVLEDVDGIAIAKLNCDENDTDKELFPEPGIPNIKFFKAGDKSNPIKYDGDRSAVSFIEFIAENTTLELDIDTLTTKAQYFDDSRDIVENLEELSQIVDEFLSRPYDGGKNITYIENRLEVIKKLQQEDKIDEAVASINELKDSDQFNEMLDLEKEYQLEEEKTRLGDVVKVHSEEEFRQQLTSDKPIIIDFTATWCGPCRRLEPHFVQLASTHKNVLFVQVDVDELAPIAQEYDIQAMPTMKVVHNGEELKEKELVGASIPLLKKLADELNSN
eukprot:TRINITY_DN89_c0_g1_i1.p1 TRINITY_DN89_c0_g1~~TRINITY_DN89_c0_g1_i1.p1  ORF type:complete len:468 (-),score=116.60 TRINITY_DN89_c0_g1_i1:48-1406(-)